MESPVQLSILTQNIITTNIFIKFDEDWIKTVTVTVAIILAATGPQWEL